MQATQLGMNGALSATPLHKRPYQSRKASRSMVTTALFTKTRTVKEEAPVVTQKKSPFSLFSKTVKEDTTTATTKKKTITTKKTVDKAAEYKKRQGLGGIISAFDFAEVRSKSDAELLYEAKYGKLEGGKMSREQYMALRRKVGGTAKDFWKTSIDVEGAYTDKGWVDKNDKSMTSSSVPALPFLVVTVLALFGTVFYVVSQTS